MEQQPYGAADSRGTPLEQAGTGQPGTGQPGTGQPGTGQPGVDLLGIDLEELRTTDHPVLSALVSDLQERMSEPGSEALWGFDNDL